MTVLELIEELKHFPLDFTIEVDSYWTIDIRTPEGTLVKRIDPNEILMDEVD